MEAVPYERACGAAMAALRALGLQPVERDKDGFQTVIVGSDRRGAAGGPREITVRISRLSMNSTELSFQAARTGDEAGLRAVHDAIRRELRGS